MKCTHDEVKSREWTQCPKCGKTVRYHKRNPWIRCVLLALYLSFASDPLIAWVLGLLHLENRHPQRLLTGLVFLTSVYFFLFYIFPNLTEKRGSSPKK